MAEAFAGRSSFPATADAYLSRRPGGGARFVAALRVGSGTQEGILPSKRAGWQGRCCRTSCASTRARSILSGDGQALTDDVLDGFISILADGESRRTRSGAQSAICSPSFPPMWDRHRAATAQ